MNVMLFDGSMEEFLMAVFQVYVEKKEPLLYREEDFIPNMIDVVEPLVFQEEAFSRVSKAMKSKFPKEALDVLTYGLNHRDPLAPTLLLKYVMACFSRPSFAFQYQDELIMRVTKLSRQVSLESHRFKGFVRFQKLQELYFAKIQPDHDILPFIADHFMDRFQEESFVIYDEKRQQAIFCQDHQWVLKKNLAPDEKLFQEDLHSKAWSMYFTHISIDTRVNPRGQKRSMPTRYWPNLPETRTQH